MRLSKENVRAIRLTADRFLQDYPDASLWLFGSRLDDEVKGGDADFCLLLAESDVAKRAAIKRQLRPALEEAVDIPSDLVVQDSLAPTKRVTEEALRRGVQIYP